MSLYLKYRPKNLQDLVGQDHIRVTLENAIAQNKLSHAYIFSGPRGTGKTSSARLVAKALTCTDHPELEAAADEGSLVDIIEIDAASNRGIDEIRDLREKIQFAPVLSNRKVYIIDEVHMLTKEAFNALLKTLEEPPQHAYFVLATTEIHKVPETIMSRCQHFQFQRISAKNIADRLEFICQSEKVTCERNALEMLAENAAGGMRDAISSLEQMLTGGAVTLDYVQEHLGKVNSQVIISFANELIQGRSQNALETLQKLVYEAYDLNQFSRELVEYLRLQMLDAVKNGEKPDRVLLVIEEVQKAAGKIKAALIPQLPLEIACVNLGGNLKTQSISSSVVPEPSSTLLQKIGFGDKKPAEVPVKKEDNKSKNLVESREEETQSKPVSALQECSAELIQDKWEEVMNQLTTGTIRAAAKSAKVLKLEGMKLHLAASTGFYADTLSGAQGLAELTSALKHSFGLDFKIHFIKDEPVTLRSAAQNTVMKEEEQKKEDKKPVQNSASVADMASEIFGA